MASMIVLGMPSERDELTSTVALLMTAWHSPGVRLGATQTLRNLFVEGWVGGERGDE